MSPIWKRVVYPWLSNTGYLRRRAVGGTFCVLTYHGILPPGYEGDSQQDGNLVSRKNFRAQLQLLKQCYHVVSAEDVRDWLLEKKPLPELAILLTCDDGLRNALTDMVPILKEEGLSCLFFVLGASIEEHPRILWYEELYLLMLAAPAGQYLLDSLGIHLEWASSAQRRSEWWKLVRKLSQFDQQARADLILTLVSHFGLPENWNARSVNNQSHRRRFDLLDGSDLRQLIAQGMSIGSHTLNHPILSQQSSESAWKEISRSRTLLESAIGKPVWALAYPFGDPSSVTTREMQMAKQAGFECAFMNVGGGFGASLPRFALPRVHVTSNMRLSEFEAHVSGFYRDFHSRLTGAAL